MTASWLQLRFGNGSHMAALTRGQPSLWHLQLHPHDGAQAACVERDKKMEARRNFGSDLPAARSRACDEKGATGPASKTIVSSRSSASGYL